MGENRKIRIGTRGSRLALVQAGMVEQGLRESGGVEPEIVTIRTEGDRRREGPLAAHGGKGLFIKELQEALRSGEVDVAVHSCKDIPAERNPEFSLVAVLPRERVCDVLISCEPVSVEGLAETAVVGTASVRRKAQLLAVRPDLEVALLRGNVDTRLRKVIAGEFDAIILAAAGIRRLGGADGVALTELDLEAFLPAPGQGAVAIETRADDSETERILSALDDPATHSAVDAERSFADELGGSCEIPIGAHAAVEEERMTLSGCILAEDGSRHVQEQITGAVVDASSLGVQLARRVKEQGGDAILRSLSTHDGE